MAYYDELTDEERAKVDVFPDGKIWLCRLCGKECTEVTDHTECGPDCPGLKKC